MAFQVKCEKRIHEMLEHATTLLLVSHNDSQVRLLCKKAVWMRDGEIVMSGDSGEVCNAYAKAFL
jgi:ABC-type polysaccharide/polyol phosphate transport system ATPase subunit